MIVNEGEASPTAYMQQDYVMEIEEDQVTTTKDNDRRVHRRHRVRANDRDLLDTTIYENITIIDTMKSEEDVNFITQSLKNHFVFYDMTDVELEHLVQNIFYCETEAEQFVIEQGQNGSSFFVLKSGVIQIIVNDQIKGELKPGDCFGELALMYNSARSASCKALTKCELWGINRPSFKSVIEEMNKNKLYENLNFINKVRFFDNFTADQKYSIAGVLISQKFNKDQAIIKQNDPASSFYIVKSGMVSCVKNGKKVGKMGPYDSFGESGLMEGNQQRALSIVAEENTVCFAIGRQILKQILGEQVETAIYKNIALLTLKKLEGFNQLTQEQQENLVSVMEFHKVNDRDLTLFVQGQQIKEALILCIQGQIVMETTKNILIGKYSGVGAHQILTEGEDIYPYNLVVEAQGVYTILKQERIKRVLGGFTLAQVLLSNKNLVAQSWMESVQRCQESSSYHIEDFESLKFLGDGQFGQVYLVRNKTNKRYFCLKVLNKSRVVSMKVEKLARQEKDVLTHINHPFMMQYYRSFQDEFNVYFLLEYVEGIEMFEAIRMIGLLGTQDSQFYISQMVLQLEYLHSKDIVYRDLKPENMMVDLNGYLRLIDMGTSKIMSKVSGKDQRTYSILGTPHYMAPEVLLGKGYDFTVDLWSLGIVFYELMCGRVPFGEDLDDPIDIYKEIFRNEVKFPDFMIDKGAVELIRQLLNKIAVLRLPGKNFNTIKQNIWFRHFDWDKLEKKQLKPSFVPPKSKINSKAFRDQIKGVPILDAVKQVAGSLTKPQQSEMGQWDSVF